ncbi:Molybdopterin or thiamine biosynthesis adenylyltransferase [Nitrosospira sp. Nsp11]|uniref:ThiF family adenylyltransferase n=1 Tax=Nitrosospira sp. Nsp11 TaxID=1855338 RepID=UPI00091725BF|nr:ThiF family adenylyltransferase [Nitrosospira sp. Nsp11]SHM08119.1 Molybdopterin or thiamine biosynthesis adenylyltransferase [Nitrosospira sp. Nsp11]
MLSFIYDEAFSRNIGWLTQREQDQLRHKRVAIAGLGGVGGLHLLTLCRLGIGKFHLADFDTFDLANFNRQAGATVSALSHSKLEVMTQQARDINPELEITGFAEGVTAGNLDDFLNGVDIYIDGLDFFAFEARQQVFAACAARRIPAVTAAPLGMGAAVLNFLPGSMSFDDYFRFEDGHEREKPLRFLMGLAPARLQMGYLVDPSTVDLANRKGPSTIMACQLCAGVAATEALKILLGRGPVRAAPKGYHFDAYRNKLVLTSRPGGNRNPLQRLAIAFAKRKLGL